MNVMREVSGLWKAGPGKLTGYENRERVREYMLSHLGATNIECADALKMSAEAVGRHIKHLRAEWNDEV
jgi:hypothetical protein